MNYVTKKLLHIFFRKKELKRNEDHPYWKVKLINTQIFAKAIFIVMTNKNVSFCRI